MFQLAPPFGRDPPRGGPCASRAESVGVERRVGIVAGEMRDDEQDAIRATKHAAQIAALAAGQHRAHQTSGGGDRRGQFVRP